MNRFTAAAIGAALVIGAPMLSPAYAQDTAAPAAGKLRFMLNSADTSPDGKCLLTFVVQNDTGTEITASSYNMAIVNAEGRVTTLITFGFGSFPQGSPKVQQFSLDKGGCETISAISINDYASCLDGAGVQTSVCAETMEQSSRTSIQFPWRL